MSETCNCRHGAVFEVHDLGPLVVTVAETSCGVNEGQGGHCI